MYFSDEFRLPLIFTILLFPVSSLKLSTIQNSFTKGYDAYQSERWSECIFQFEESLYAFKLFRTLLSNCRISCYVHSESYLDKSCVELDFYAKLLKRRNCLSKCYSENFDNPYPSYEIDTSVFAAFENRKPYEYLHICYFQMNRLPQAASSAYTYLIANANDEDMKNNLKYYVEQPEVDINNIVDLESKEFEDLHKAGIEKYNQKNWKEAIKYLEEALNSYMEWENTCRSECDLMSDQKTFQEFTFMVSSCITTILKCKQLCQRSVNVLSYNTSIEFIADILNYLQISYYHMNKYDNLARTVSTYLMLMPNDAEMVANKRIYDEFVDKMFFENRSDIVEYMKRNMKEKMLLRESFQIRDM